MTRCGHRLCIAAFKTISRHRLWQCCGLCATGAAPPPVESLSEFGKACILMRLCARPPVREGEADSFRSAASMRALAILFCTVNTRFFGVGAYAITNDAMPLRL